MPRHPLRQRLGVFEVRTKRLAVIVVPEIVAESSLEILDEEQGRAALKKCHLSVSEKKQP